MESDQSMMMKNDDVAPVSAKKAVPAFISGNEIWETGVD